MESLPFLSRLPKLEDFFTEAEFSDKQMLQWKDALNATKTKLDGIDLGAWDKHTKFTNLMGGTVHFVFIQCSHLVGTLHAPHLIFPFVSDVPYNAKNQIDTEMCTIAWIKMYELLFAYDLIPQGTRFFLYILFLVILKLYHLGSEFYLPIKIMLIQTCLSCLLHLFRRRAPQQCGSFRPRVRGAGCLYLCHQSFCAHAMSSRCGFQMACCLPQSVL